ncbi:MAG: YdcF family protein [Alphaproteobacteria bacterium]|nr:MAG: YdcF family protein [Alphaproteobacteria bacterium]
MIYVLGLIKQLILPPALFMVGLVAAGVLLWRGRVRAARWLGGVSLVALWLLSTPLVSDGLMGLAQWGVEPLRDPGEAGAIVVLSAGAQVPATEYGAAADVDAMTLERLRYGARLARDTHLPVLVSGGKWSREEVKLAPMMARVLTDDFGVEEVWLEDRSRATRGNAAFSAEVLKARGVTTVLLVTHAWHMKRAQAVFEREGLVVIPAPTAFEHPGHFGLGSLFPQAKALHRSYYAAHELVGRVWYALLG